MLPQSKKTGAKNPPPEKESDFTMLELNPSSVAPPSAVEEQSNPEAEVLEATAATETEEDEEVPAEDEEAEDEEVYAKDEADHDHEVSAKNEEADIGDNLMGTEQEVAEDWIEKSKAEEIEGDGEGVAGDDDGLHDGESEDDDPSTKRNNKKELDIYIGRLHKEAVENDLVKVFGRFGEIESVKIVKHPLTQRSKGYAFIRYKSSKHAKKALTEFKDGTKVKGKWVKVSSCPDNDTLYFGNICKTWTRNYVIEALKGYGVEHIEQIYLPDDPKSKGKIKGFAHLEFSSHADAMAAFRRLRSPDALFGCDRSAKVAFTHTPTHPSEEVMSQVKTVYIEGLPLSWDEEKVEEICKEYGEIKRVKLLRNLAKQKRNDFGFIVFTSRASAVSCVEGINDAQFGEGEVKVKACLAKPPNKSRLVKQSARGGFYSTTFTKLNEVRAKGKAQPRMKNIKGTMLPKSQEKDALAHPRTSQSAKGKRRGGRILKTDIDERPSKIARNSGTARSSTGSGNPRNAQFGNKKSNFVKRPVTFRNAVHEPAYQDHAHTGASGSEYHISEMESRAEFPPAAHQGRNPYAYSSQPSSASGYAAVYVLPASYPDDYSSYLSYQAGCTYPRSAGYTLDGAYYYYY